MTRYHRSPITTVFRCQCTKSNPIDDHVAYLQKRSTRKNSNHWATIPACSSVPPIYKQSKKPYYHFSDLQEVYSGNRQIHITFQLKFLHLSQISTSGKCHCVIIQQAIKAAECIGYNVIISAQVTTVRYMHQSQPALFLLLVNSDLAITWFSAMPRLGLCIITLPVS